MVDAKLFIYGNDTLNNRFEVTKLILSLEERKTLKKNEI